MAKSTAEAVVVATPVPVIATHTVPTGGALPVGVPMAVPMAMPIARPPPAKLERRNTMQRALLERGWPPGLTHAVATSIEAFPARFVIVDNSGSMQTMDGERLVSTADGDFKAIRSSRWQELGDVVNELGEVVTRLGAETHFHLLNPTPEGQHLVLEAGQQGAAEGEPPLVGRAGAPAELSTLRRAMKTSPCGTTPLTEACELVYRCIAPHADALRARGQQCVVVLATDGKPNNPHSFLRALQELQRLPVWLVVRLCTNEASVVEYWSELDAQLEAPLETLDDVAGEAKEVHAHNPWLGYTPALHLARTLGLKEKLFDLIDERPLAPTQAKQLIEAITGCDELPEPELDPKAFYAAVAAAVGSLPKVYNALERRRTPWVDVGALKRHVKRAGHAEESGCALM